MSAASPKALVTSIKEGQIVKFIPRDASTEARSVPYYDFYASLSGTVAKIYDDATAAVLVDRATLSEEALLRHQKSEQDMRDKWMRSLSEEDRGKLTDAQKRFSLRYTLLANVSDLIDIKATPPASVVKAKSESAPTGSSAPKETMPRLTEEDLAAKEAAHLEEINRRAKQD
jgi:hypothetical protein